MTSDGTPIVLMFVGFTASSTCYCWLGKVAPIAYRRKS